MRVLLAFDKFKGSLEADEACRIGAKALLGASPALSVATAPLTDGGEAFAQILTHHLGGEVERISVTGPQWKPVIARIGWVDLASLPAAAARLLDVPATGHLAILEMAQAAGLAQVPAAERNPWHTTTYGVGEMIAHAHRSGAAAILLGIGGSATNDAGLGALEALGITAYDRELQAVRQLSPDQWTRVNTLGGLVNYRESFPPIRIACDVRNPLTGSRGATAVFGPQKGLTADDLPRLERQMDKMGRRLLGLFRHPLGDYDALLNAPGAGAAGGLGFGLVTAFPQARLVPGFPVVTALLGLDATLAQADMVISGEGRFDVSSLEGKGPWGVLLAVPPAARKILLVGSVEADAAAQALTKLPGLEIIELTPPDWELSRRLAAAPEALAEKLQALGV